MAFIQTVAIFLGIVLASSLDGFWVGVSYSARGLHIASAHYKILAFCTGFLMLLSMGLGRVVMSFLPPCTGKRLGAAILILLGAQQTLRSLGLRQASSYEQSSLEIREEKQGTPKPTLGLLATIKNIADNPLKADQDDSKTIDNKEAYLLGMALGIDALAAGLGTSVAGFSMFLIPAAAIASPAFVYAGVLTGRLSVLGRFVRENRFLPGLILMLIGATKLFC